MLRKVLFLSFLLAASVSSADNRSLPDRQIDSTLVSNKVVFIDGRPAESQIPELTDSLRRKIITFYYDQFHHFQDPGAPYFLFMSKDAALAMGIGGAVRMRGYYDWGGAIPASGFAPYLIPMTPDMTNMRHFGTTPAGTCLFFRVLGRNKKLGEYQLYVEANFNGYNSRDFHLKKAYAIINNVTIGYASSTYSDPAALPPTVDAQGPNNKISPTSVLIRYMPVVRDRWYFAVSAETPDATIAADGVKTAKVSTWLPDFAAFTQYQWAPGQHVRLAGIVRNLPYRDLIQGKTHNKTGWGLLLSSVAHPLPEVTTYATVNYGHGNANLGGDLLIGNYDLYGDPDSPGRLYAPASWGWNLGIQYNFRPNLFMTLSASQTRFLPAHRVDADEYKYGLWGGVNIFWNLTPRIQVAAEYDLGARHNFSHSHRTAQRVGAMCQFSF